MGDNVSFLERATIKNIAKFIKNDDVHIHTATPTVDLYAARIAEIEKLVRAHVQTEKEALALLGKIDRFYVEIEELAFLCGLRAGARLLLDLLPPQ